MIRGRGPASTTNWPGPFASAAVTLSGSHLGVPHIIAHPAIIRALSPHHAVLFVLDRPFIAFIALGAVVLTITGA